MVIFYDLDTKKIKRTEDFIKEPQMPFGMTKEEKIEYYKSINEGFIYYDKEEIGWKAFLHDILFDEEGNFVDLIPK